MSANLSSAIVEEEGVVAEGAWAANVGEELVLLLTAAAAEGDQEEEEEEEFNGVGAADLADSIGEEKGEQKGMDGDVASRGGRAGALAAPCCCCCCCCTVKEGDEVLLLLRW